MRDCQVKLQVRHFVNWVRLVIEPDCRLQILKKKKKIMSTKEFNHLFLNASNIKIHFIWETVSP